MTKRLRPGDKVTRTTDKMLARMLTENTGRALCDSGDAYGRNYERNAGRGARAFKDAPAATLDVRAYGPRPGEPPDTPLEWYMDGTLDVFHFLSDRVEYDAEQDRRFWDYVRFRADSEEGWLDIMDEGYPEYLRDRGHEVKGLYGEGKPFTVNTYNGEDMLSQVIQYTYMEIDGEPYALIQIHGGCDVRGGYTRPRMFRVYDDGTGLFDNASATISCEYRGDPGEPLPGMPEARDYPHYWTTDDTCNWYEDGSTAGTNLEDYEATTDPAERGEGKVYINPDTHTAHCPHDGTPLSLYP